MAAQRTLVFDVNDTLTDQSLFADRLTQVGAPASLSQTWYAATLRDGIALSLVGAAAPYADVARAVLLGLLSGVDGLSADPQDAVEHVMAGFEHIDPHPDVVPGMRALAATGHTLVTLSNGAVGVADGMLRRHGIRDCVSQVLSAADAGAWKPHPHAYAHAVRRTATPAHELVMVAVHPWDLDGASRAGLGTAYLDRTGRPWPAVFRRPDYRAETLEELRYVLVCKRSALRCRSSGNPLDIRQIQPASERHVMSNPGVPETSENAQTQSHSAGEPDAIHHDEQGKGSDVGGPAATTESSTEDAITGTSTVGADDDPDSQETNPL